MASSFKKKSSRGRLTYPAGTKISLNNNQLLISSGVPSLDTLLGGGVAVGTVVLVEEDNYGCYAKTLVKCFLAEGVTSGHTIFLATADVDPEDIWKNLPCPLGELIEKSPSKDEVQSASGDNSMKIAWRYQNVPQVQSGQATAKFGHFYDFTKIIDHDRINKASKYQFKARNSWMKESDVSLSEDRSFFNPMYRNLFNCIKEIIEEKGHCTASQELQAQTILRIAIQSMDSPLWGARDSLTSDHSLTMFLYYLRGLLRSSYAVCFITVPSYLIEDTAAIGRIERLSDTVIRLESFLGSDKETNPIYKDYHGLFHLVRLPRLNSLTCHMPDTLDLAFKLRRKKFVIEKLHLPPDISETANHDRKEQLSLNTGTYSCAQSLGGSKLDF